MLKFYVSIFTALPVLRGNRLFKRYRMKNIFKSIAVFIVMSVVLSGFVACTKTTNVSNGSVSDTAGSDTSSAPPKNNNYPPAPSAIMQAEIKDLDGNTFKLEDKKGKVVLVNLWGIWCGPCVAEMPALMALQEKYKDKDFEVIGLNIGDQNGDVEPAENIKSFAEQKNVNYQLAYADEDLFSHFVKLSKLAAVPQSLLIDRDGRMTGVFAGGGSRVINQIKETVEKTVGE